MRRLLVLSIGILLIADVFFLRGQSPDKDTNNQDARPIIATTIFPLYDIVNEISGDAFRVVLLLPPGTSEHLFEPTPTTLRQLSEAQIVFAVGHGLDDWLQTLAPDRERIVVVDEDISLKASSDEEKGSPDPHYWLTLQNGAAIAKTINKSLVARFPALDETITQRTDRYITQLLSEDKKLKQLTADLSQKKMVTFHDAWAYFAEAYGLQIVGTFEPSPGREPTPQYLSRIKETMATHALSVIYTEPQFSSNLIASFAKDYDVRLAELDPVGGFEKNNSYIKLITTNVQTIIANQ